MESIRIPSALLTGVSLQRYALLKFFRDHPGCWYTRFNIMDAMEKEPYASILDPWRDSGTPGPFSSRKGERKIPTVLRDRLADLLEAGLIEEDTRGREIEYRLRREASQELSEEEDPLESDAEMLLAMGSSMSGYSGIPFGDLLESLSAKAMRLAGKKRSEAAFSIVDFETPFIADSNHRDLIATLYYAINDRCIIPLIKYLGHYPAKGHPQTKEVRDFMPYLLKESRGQWFLVGKCKGDKEFRVIPGNRIIGEVSIDSERTFKREKFDPAEYWKGCAGIMRLGKPVNLSFEVKNGPKLNNIDYIRMIPLVRGCQRIKKKGEWMQVKLEQVYAGPELIRDIRSFGRNNIRNVKPAWFGKDLWEDGSPG